MAEEQANYSTTAPTGSASSSKRPSDKAARDVEFSLFYKEDLPRLVGFLVVHGARSVVAADLAQEAMAEVYRKWDSIDSPRAWVRTVATRMWWRWQHISQQQHIENPSEHVLLSEAASDEIETGHAFIAAIRRLPPEQRQVMAWTYDGYRPTEIAAILGKNPATVRSTLRAAREALRREFPPGWDAA
jgi:RNA polymerase sigma-70 factor (ECF subfamily)